MKKKLLRIGLMFFTAAALIAGMVFPVAADAAAPNSALHNIQGTVTSIAADNSSFVVQNGNQSPMTVKVNQNTRFMVVPLGKANTAVKSPKVIPSKIMPKQNGNNNGNRNNGNNKKGPELPQISANTNTNMNSNAQVPDNWKSSLGWLDSFDSKGKLSDVQVGDRVIASVNNPDNFARQVLIIKAPVIQTIKGTITTVNGNSVTITPASGAPVTVTVAAKTVVTLHGLLSVQAPEHAISVYNKNTLVAQTLNVQAAAPAATTNNAPVAVPDLNLSAITITANPAVSGNFTAGSTRLFTATGSYSNGSAINITGQVVWASSNPAVAVITGPGSVTAVAPGTVNITASKEGITSLAVVLSVSNP
jgi:hypothetical protein